MSQQQLHERLLATNPNYAACAAFHTRQVRAFEQEQREKQSELRSEADEEARFQEGLNKVRAARARLKARLALNPQE